MALSLSTAVKNKVAQRLGSVTYANANANTVALIDGEGASALVTIEEESQYFTMTTTTGQAPDAWEAYFVDEIVLRVAQNTHPERVPMYTKQRDMSRIRIFDAYARRAMSYDPSSITEAFVQTTQNIRNYVMAHCIRQKPALIPTAESVDSAMWEVLSNVWSRSGWPFRRRPVTYRITRTEFTAGTWVESTKTLTVASGVSTSLPTGARIYVTDGTGVSEGEYPVTSTTSTTVVLAQSLSTAGTNLTAADIEFFYYVVTIVGLESGETVDSIATNRLHLAATSSAFEPRELVWATADDFARWRAETTLSVDTPSHFRTLMIAPSSLWLLFYPAPDDDYVFTGEALIAMPSSPSSASATTTFTKFDSAFGPVIRRAVLDHVYTNYGRNNSELHAQVVDEIERLFPTYADVGDTDDRVERPDVYGDFGEATGWSGMLGGGI